MDSPVKQELLDALIIEGRIAVRLDFSRPGSNYFEPDFIRKCVDEVMRLEIRAAVGDEINPLERLALILLFESAGYDVKPKTNKTPRTFIAGE